MEKKKTRIKEHLGMAYKTGLGFGAEAFLKAFSRYRRLSGYFFLALMIFFLFIGKEDLAIICLGFMHLTILYNQLWWRMNNNEHYK